MATRVKWSRKSDGVGANNEDGGQGEDDLEAVIKLTIAHNIEADALGGLPIVDHRLGDVVAWGYVVACDVDWAEVGFDGTNFV